LIENDKEEIAIEASGGNRPISLLGTRNPYDERLLGNNGQETRDPSLFDRK